MEHWLEFVKGPLFIATFSLMILGLGRLVFLRLYLKAVLWLTNRENRPKEPWSFRRVLGMFVPTRRLPPIRPFLGAVSLIFHVGLITAPLFLAEHLMMWKSGMGIGWHTFGRPASDFLTLMTIVTGLTLIGVRSFHGASRRLSSWKDYVVLVLLLVPFVTGFISMHPQFLFTRVESMILVHVLSAELVFALLPFTSMSHVVLMLLDRAVSDFYLRLPAGGRARIEAALGQERMET